MGQLVSLGDYRRQAQGRNKRKEESLSEGAGLDARPTYYCMGCGHDEFSLYPGGAVHCAHCSALMDNLGVVTRPGRGQQTK
jgi:hypothetical protein